MKIAELIRDIKATNGKIEETLAVLGNNTVEILIPEGTPTAERDEVIDKAIKKTVEERVLTTEGALKEFDDLSSRLIQLRLALDSANASTIVPYKGDSWVLKAILMRYAEKQRLATALRSMPTRNDENSFVPSEAPPCRGPSRRELVQRPQMSAKAKKLLLGSLVKEIRELDVLIQKTNWKEDVKV